MPSSTTTTQVQSAARSIKGVIRRHLKCHVFIAMPLVAGLIIARATGEALLVGGVVGKVWLHNYFLCKNHCFVLFFSTRNLNPQLFVNFSTFKIASCIFCTINPTLHLLLQIALLSANKEHLIPCCTSEKTSLITTKK